MQWSGLAEWNARPVVVVVEAAGGELDLLLHDADLATFLNDRFQSWFLLPEVTPAPLPQHGVVFLDAQGCKLAEAALPDSAAEWIALNNAVLLSLHEDEGGQPWSTEPAWTALTPPPGHPLRLTCPRSSRGAAPAAEASPGSL